MNIPRWLLLMIGLGLPAIGEAVIVYTTGMGWEREFAPPGRDFLSRYVQDIDLNGDGTLDFYFGFGGIDFRLIPFTDNLILSTRVLPSGIGRNTVALTTGALIGSAPPTGEWLGLAAAANRFDLGSVVYSLGSSTIPNGEERFFGVEFFLEDGPHYGWIALLSHLTGTDGYVRGWAYETEPGQPILAGAVPEPGVTALAAGALLLSWRRRR